jgi:hypothetical protein
MRGAAAVAEHPELDLQQAAMRRRSAVSRPGGREAGSGNGCATIDDMNVCSRAHGVTLRYTLRATGCRSAPRGRPCD